MNNVDLLFEKIDKGRAGKNIGLSTGIPKLDAYTGGIQRAIYTLIFGISGAGKSALALYSYIYRPLKDYPDKDIKICYFSLELSAELLLGKLLCLYLYEEYGIVVPYTDLMSWQNILSDEQYKYVLKGKEWLNQISEKLIIFDSALTSKNFYSKLKGLLEQDGSFEKSADGRRTLYTKNNPEQLFWVVVDHLNLTTPIEGRSKKEEIDTISKYAVTLRNMCGVSFFMLMQENRNSSSMDRRKAELTECSSEDIQDTGGPFQDSEVCIGVYYPLKFKLRTHKHFPIIVENDPNFSGMRDRYRSLQLIKNRHGLSERAIPVNFFGEINLFRELPKGDTITDYSPYLSLSGTAEQQKDEVPKELKKEIIYKF